MQTYKIPNRKKKLLTKEFLETFKDELDKIFYKGEIDPSKRNYMNTYQHVESTVGFGKALRIACEKYNLVKAIYNYEDKLPWYDSDLFDSEIMDIMIEKDVIKEGSLDEDIYDYTKDEVEWTNEGDIQWYKSIIQFKGYNIVSYDFYWTNKEMFKDSIDDCKLDNEIRIPIEGLPPHLKDICQ